ncbi:FG-GAP repeat domain-containing protein [Streptomyces sp. NBC_00334]|uniref:FG-GAP repeat domain-containing protein n=1 Tax=Streptomyces sp. NBC_00334 TaxID=2975713 RepID=UPI002E2CB116|nr:VCBS repeat-containing protein [Streptomyces sp. NBC_00334]
MAEPVSPQQASVSRAFAARLRRPYTRGRRRLVLGTGAALAAGATTLALWSGPEPGDHAPTVVCTDTGNTSLTADVDADGRLDEIHDPDRSGRGTVLFSRADDRVEVGVGEALGVWQKARGLLTSDLETRGTFGDFDGDGYLDLALFRSQEDIGDNPRPNLLVHEVRYGPLARDLSGSRSGTIRVQVSFFVAAVRATDEDQDGRAELHVFQSAGDGGYAEYVGRQKDGGVTLSAADTGYYSHGDWDELQPGWSDFGTCVYTSPESTPSVRREPSDARPASGAGRG